MSLITLAKAAALIAALLVQPSVAGYALEDDYNTENFFDKFEFFTAPDPTGGFVQYVDQGTAWSNGLISNSHDTITMGVDHTNIAPTGRKSVRITSNKVYNHGLILLDVAHMPEGCGTWPAFWTTGPDWPSQGEIDIIEGVNSQAQNAMTLHTGPGCSLKDNNLFSGKVKTYSCDVNAYGQSKNAGCGISAEAKYTYGSGLNGIQGGVYATEWNSDAISTWFFPRYDIPVDITSGKPSPGKWGKPLASFSSGGCTIDNSIKNQQIVFDTTFCGDWAGNTWSSDTTCSAKASSCQDFVANNPQAFTNAYWEINSLKVYQDNGEDTPAPPVSIAPAGPTGIASQLPSAVASLAPIPASSAPVPDPTTFAVSTKAPTSPPAVPLSDIGSWNLHPHSPGDDDGGKDFQGHAAAFQPLDAAAAANSVPAAASAVPLFTPTPAPAVQAAAVSSPALSAPPPFTTWTPPPGAEFGLANPLADGWQENDPVPADWFAPVDEGGDGGIPVEEWRAGTEGQATPGIAPAPVPAPSAAAPVAAPTPATKQKLRLARRHARHVLEHVERAKGPH